MKIYEIYKKVGAGRFEYVGKTPLLEQVNTVYDNLLETGIMPEEIKVIIKDV